MLTFHDLLGAVERLTPEDRLALLEATARLVKADGHFEAAKEGQPVVDKATASEYVPFIRPDLLNLDEEALKAQGITLRGTPVQNVLGIGWAAEDGPPPTDAQNREDYLNLLTEKYR